MTVVIELCGLPGAGKSTLCRAVGDELAGRGVEVEQRGLPGGRAGRRRRLLAKTSGLLATLARRPSGLARVGRVAWSSGLRGRELVARTVNVVVFGGRAQARPGTVVLFDQAVVQELVAVGVTADAATFARRLSAADWPVADVLVVVEVDVETAVGRLTGRRTGESRLEHLRVEQRRAALDQARATLDRVVGEARARGAQVWRVSTEDPEAVTTLCTRICRTTDR